MIIVQTNHCQLDLRCDLFLVGVCEVVNSTHLKIGYAYTNIGIDGLEIVVPYTLATTSNETLLTVDLSSSFGTLSIV